VASIDGRYRVPPSLPAECFLPRKRLILLCLGGKILIYFGVFLGCNSFISGGLDSKVLAQKIGVFVDCGRAFDSRESMSGRWSFCWEWV
jgi:hypothetical protein